MPTSRSFLFAVAMAVLAAGQALAASPHRRPPVDLPGTLVLIAAGVALVVAGVAVFRLYRSSFEGKPKFPPRDPS